MNDCSIEKFDGALNSVGMMLDLSSNEITNMPREELGRFLEEGGELNYDRNIKIDDIKAGGIDLTYNPLVYPPQHIFEEGKEAVKSYLQEYEDDMMEPDRISLLLIGKQEVGKTSLCRTLAGKISNASESAKDDRTQVFDIMN